MPNMKTQISLNQGCLFVSGNLDFKTVVNLWAESLPLLLQCRELKFDLSGVAHANSAAIALLLEWLKYAKQYHKSIIFSGLPSQLRSIAAVLGVEKLLKM